MNRRTDTQKLQIVVSMSRLPQAGSTKISNGWHLISNYDLDLWQRFIKLHHDMPTHQNEHFCQVIWNYDHDLHI